MMSSRSVVKSPTSVAKVPTFTLEPFVLIRTWSRSGNVPSVVRVQKVSVAPFSNVTDGVRSQLLRVDRPEPLWKLTAT